MPNASGLLDAAAGKKGAHKDDLTGVATKDDIQQLRSEFGKCVWPMATAKVRNLVCM